MSSTTNNTIDSPSVTDLQPPTIDSPASTTFEKVESSPEPEESESTHSMLLIPYASSQYTSNEAHAHLEDPAWLTSGNVYSVDIPPWIASASPTHHVTATNTFPFSIPPTLGLLPIQQAVAFDDDSQQTHAASTLAHSFHGQPIFGLSGFLCAHLDAAVGSQPPHAPGTAPAPSHWTTATNALWMGTIAHHHHQQQQQQQQQQQMSLEDFLGPEMALTFRHHHARMSFDAAAFVDTLEEVDITSIAPEDMMCPHCWLPFGTTTEEDDLSILAYMGDEEREITWRLNASYELPFCENKPNNDPVKTPCGHIFGKQCLVQSLEETNTTCPMCRRELDASVPTHPLGTSPSFDDLPALIPIS